jgi:hypothetical protein
MTTLAEATHARDQLVGELMIEHDCPEVVGIGIAKEGDGYVVAVDVTENVDLPPDVDGVPVRVALSAEPEAY